MLLESWNQAGNEWQADSEMLPSNVRNSIFLNIKQKKLKVKLEIISKWMDVQETWISEVHLNSNNT